VSGFGVPGGVSGLGSGVSGLDSLLEPSSAAQPGEPARRSDVGFKPADLDARASETLAKVRRLRGNLSA